METKLIIRFQLEITNVLKDGFIGKEVKLGWFRKEARLQDKFTLTNGFKEGDIIWVTIETINENEIKEDKKSSPITFYRLINELTFYGFFTKLYTKNEDIFKRFFKFEETGMVILFDKEDRFEVGDILKISVKNGNRN